jgi:hypothetical protein
MNTDKTIEEFEIESAENLANKIESNRLNIEKITKRTADTIDKIEKTRLTNLLTLHTNYKKELNLIDSKIEAAKEKLKYDNMISKYAKFEEIPKDIHDSVG